MTKKHYIEIAKQIKLARGQAECIVSRKYAIDQVVANLSRLFKAENPKFDSASFEAACEAKS